MPYVLALMPILLRMHPNRRGCTQRPVAEGGFPAGIPEVGDRGRVAGRSG